MIEAAVVAVCLENEALAKAVERRVHWGRRTSDKLPALVLHQISGQFDYTLNAASGYQIARVQFDTLAETATRALEVQALALPLFSGVRRIINGVELLGCFVQNLAGPDDAPDAYGKALFRARFDLQIHYRRA